MGNTLNKTQSIGMISIIIAMAMIAFIAVSMFLGDFTFAAGGTFIGTGAKNLISDMSIVIALATIIVGIVQVVKGATSRAIIIFVVGGLLAAVCAKPDVLTSLGNAIFGLFDNFK